MQCEYVHVYIYIHCLCKKDFCTWIGRFGESQSGLGVSQYQVYCWDTCDEYIRVSILVIAMTHLLLLLLLLVHPHPHHMVNCKSKKYSIWVDLYQFYPLRKDLRQPSSRITKIGAFNLEMKDDTFCSKSFRLHSSSRPKKVNNTLQWSIPHKFIQNHHMKRRSVFVILRWQITTRFTNLNGFFSASNKTIFTPQNIYKPPSSWEKSFAPVHQDLRVTSGFDAPIQLVEDDATTPGAGRGFCWKKIHERNPTMEVVAFSKKDRSTCESDIKTNCCICDSSRGLFAM